VVLDLAAFRPHDVAEIVRRFRGQRYVFVSTGSVYPDLDGRPAREDDFQPLEGEVPDGALPYAEGKRWCETVLSRSSGLPYAVVRPPAVLGADDHTLRIAAYVQRVEDGGPLLVPEETCDRQLGLAWARDVGYACALVCDVRREVAGAYNVAFEGVSLRNLLEAIGRGLGKPVPLRPVPFDRLPEGAGPYGPHPGRPAGLDVSRARAELGFQPSSLEEALAETLAWYLARRPSHPGYAGRERELEIAARG
jgi:2'-hydroxyisoflavone reductase